VGVDTRADVVVVGAGPAGSAAAAWAARAGRDVLLVDAADFPRDKPCGDGLTPRAVAELQLLGLGGWLDEHIKHRGLRLTGFGSEVEVDWPGPSFPACGSAVPRTELDERIRQVAADSGAAMRLGSKVVDLKRDLGGRVSSLVLKNGTGVTEVGCPELIVADGARSPLGRSLGRQWHQRTVYGVAVRGYLASPRSNEAWLSTNLELRTRRGALMPGYGWIFPLGNGEVNIGVGALATDKRPADVALRRLIDHYTDLRRDEWGFDAPPRAVSSALLPMGGAVSGVAGPNWMLIGDAAACVNPLNGEGIDYGLETGRMAADLLGSGDLSAAWPWLLQQQYARAFSIARRLSALLTVPWFVPAGGPIAMRSAALMEIVVRVMGNLVTDDDTDWVARLWRRLGSGSRRIDRRPPFS
jgi:geranylgeranyl reductase family protein